MSVLINNMQEISNWDMTKLIASDYVIPLKFEQRIYHNQFPMKGGKRKIHARYDSIIVHSDGSRYPYMLPNGSRNNDKLVEFDYICTIITKSLLTVVAVAETKHKFKYERCKLDEGGGCWSWGTRMYYKDYYTEF